MNASEMNGIFDGKTINSRHFNNFHCWFSQCISGIFPYAGLDLAIYEGLKNWYIEKHDLKNEKRPGLLVIVGIPLVSSSCGQAASYPLTLVRTRLQVASTNNLPKVSFVRMLWEILRAEGYRGLYRGFAPNAMKAGPAAVISYLTYETALNFFGIHMTWRGKERGNMDNVIDDFCK